MTRPEASLPPSNASGLIRAHLSTGFFASPTTSCPDRSLRSYTATYRTPAEVDPYIMRLVSVAAGVAIQLSGQDWTGGQVDRTNDRTQRDNQGGGAEALGISVEAVRKRIERGQLGNREG